VLVYTLINDKEDIKVEYLIIPTICYAIWRIYTNYRNDIKNSSEISLFVGAVIALIGNKFFKDSLFALVCQLIFIFLITLHINRTTRK